MPIKNFALSVKAFIVKDNKLLVVKRRDNDPHKPGVWEIPGGRLALGENPFDGLQREIREEVGLRIEIMNPLRVQHFTREDSQEITMIKFLCKPVTEETRLSKEHTCLKWVSMEEALLLLPDFFHDEIKLFKKHFQGKTNF
ncbi:MAG: NUDIX domain-containing protein [Candidatus Diapherotrites archaeon]|nr:NUDIX domain-containing protein [Candidatus Diapherotrites archaeon]